MHKFNKLVGVINSDVGVNKLSGSTNGLFTFKYEYLKKNKILFESDNLSALDLYLFYLKKDFFEFFKKMHIFQDFLK